MPNYYLLLPMDSWTDTVAPQGYAAHRLGTTVLDITPFVTYPPISSHNTWTESLLHLTWAAAKETTHSLFRTFLFFFFLTKQRFTIFKAKEVWNRKQNTRFKDLTVTLRRFKYPGMCYRAAGCAVAWVLQDHGAVAPSPNTHTHTPINTAHIPEHVNHHETGS
jgi:hypothetical protein